MSHKLASEAIHSLTSMARAWCGVHPPPTLVPSLACAEASGVCDRRSSSDRCHFFSVFWPPADRRRRIRLLLRAPCLSHPTLGASSTPIVARSLSRILHTYASLAATNLFHPCWAQLRRIVTCGQLLVLCTTARELGRSEAEELFAVFLALLKEHIGKFDFIPEYIAAFESVGAFVGEYRGVSDAVPSPPRTLLTRPR